MEKTEQESFDRIVADIKVKYKTALSSFSECGITYEFKSQTSAQGDIIFSMDEPKRECKICLCLLGISTSPLTKTLDENELILRVIEELSKDPLMAPLKDLKQ